MFLRLTTAVCSLGILVGGLQAAAPDTDAILASGKFDEGITTLEEHLKQNPKDDSARFGLATVQFVEAVQSLGRKLVVYGPQTRGTAELDAIFGKPSKPEKLLTYPRLREILNEWLLDLTRVEATLAKIESNDVKLPIHVARIPLNFAREGVQALTLVPLLNSLGRDAPADVVIEFDRADVDWMRGYCHLLAAFCEIGLAYDAQELFDVFSHRVFTYAETPHKFLKEQPRRQGGWLDFEEIADIIGAIHMIRFPVKEPKRMEAALGHIEQTLALSRSMWKLILAEKDNDHEWIPGPGQMSVLGVGVTQEMVDHWIIALDETESILKGKKLLPFWRGKLTNGVNLRKAFLEPRTLDLVMWIHGAAATPYLEAGEITRPDTWEQINRVFRGQFLVFGIWFN